MKRRLLPYILAALLATGPACAQSQLLLGAGAPTVSGVSCVAFLPAAFNSSTLYIDWRVSDGLGAFGMACLNGTSAVAASTLGSFQGTGSSTSAAGLALNGSGYFLFSNVTWLTQAPLTLYADYTINTLSNSVVLAISDGTLSNDIQIRNQKPLSQSTLQGRSDVSASPSLFSSGVVQATATAYKAGASFASGARAIAVNGANTASDATSPPLSGLTTATVGADGAGTSKTTATIRVTAVFAAANTTTQLATLTTP